MDFSAQFMHLMKMHKKECLMCQAECVKNSCTQIVLDINLITSSKGPIPWIDFHVIARSGKYCTTAVHMSLVIFKHHLYPEIYNKKEKISWKGVWHLKKEESKMSQFNTLRTFENVKPAVNA
jgi:hypothetical protein